MGPASAHKGILLLGFGAPESLEDVAPFLKNVLAGRPLPSELVPEVQARYRLIGGRSPLLEITRRQARALEHGLACTGRAVPVYIGMRHWRPFLAEILSQMQAEGVRDALCVIMSPYQTPAAAHHYREAVKTALAERRLTMQVRFAPSWHAEPRYLDALAEGVHQGLARFPGARKEDVALLFTAHSLPVRAVRDDPYVRHLEETIAGLKARVGDHPWRLAYQSRGQGGQEWLAPGVDRVVEELSVQGRNRVLVVPLGFVSDHLETLYDLDIVLQGRAKALGVTYRRAPAPNDAPRFIAALTHIILQAWDPQ